MVCIDAVDESVSVEVSVVSSCIGSSVKEGREGNFDSLVLKKSYCWSITSKDVILRKWPVIKINHFFTRHIFTIILNVCSHRYPITAVSLFAFLLTLLEELHRYMRIEQHVRPQSLSAQLSCN